MHARVDVGLGLAKGKLPPQGEASGIPITLL
jgi:hypothetical protein